MKIYRKLRYNLPIVLILALFIYGCEPSKNHKSITVCQELIGKISVDELILKIEQPYEKELTQQGTIFHFESNPFAAGSVKFLIDVNNGQVIGKKCFEDLEWTHFSDSSTGETL